MQFQLMLDGASGRPELINLCIRRRSFRFHWRSAGSRKGGGQTPAARRSDSWDMMIERGKTTLICSHNVEHTKYVDVIIGN
jgi:hypothetical protein